MRVRVSDISPHGLKISDTIDLEALNSRMKEGRPTDITFSTAPEVDLFVQKSATGAEAKGSIIVKYSQNCARCTEKLEQKYSIPFNYTFQHTSRNDPDEINDVGIVAYNGEHVDLEELIQEEIILSLSYSWSPELDKSSNCSLCKKEFSSTMSLENKGNSLGELLERAGVKK